MEIVEINSDLIDNLALKTEQLANSVKIFCQSNMDKCLKKWLDSSDVCQLLNISKRTLQTYRENGKISFSQIGYKIYYKSEEIEALLNKTKGGCSIVFNKHV